jgi:hypothetical protein
MDGWGVRLGVQVPKTVKPKKVKNVEYDDLGNRHGRIHMERQDFNKLQTRKVKGMSYCSIIRAVCCSIAGRGGREPTMVTNRCSAQKERRRRGG